MSKKKQKRWNSYKTSALVILVLSLFVALHCLVYAIECSVAAKNLDAYWATAYSGQCVEFSEFRLRTGRHSSGAMWYKFELNNGKVVADSQDSADKAGFDPEQFESLCGQPMDFAYTKLLRPFNMQHSLLGIRHQGKDLLSAETMQKNTRKDATGFYIIFGILLMFSLFCLMEFLMAPIEKLCKRIKNKRNRKRKQEKKERYYAKQQLNNEKINSSKGD